MSEEKSLLEVLEKVDCFSSLDTATLRHLQEEMKLLVYEAGAVICREGETGRRMFVVRSGSIVVSMLGEHKTPVVIATLRPGEITGVMSLFDEKVRSATLTASTRTEVWALEHGTFQHLLERHPPMAQALLAHLCRLVRRETVNVAQLLSRSSDRRVKVAIFDSKPYTELTFKQRNRFDFALHFFENRLSLESAAMAAGFKAICVFVNDCLDKKVIEQLQNLGVELIALRCAGYNNVDLQACGRYGLSVVRVPAYSPYAVAEHAVGLMLALNRRIHHAHNRVREGNFSLNGLVGFDMHGKTAGVVGTGKIGKCLVSILAGFGCRILAYDVRPDRETAARPGVEYVSLERIFSDSDIISLHAPLIPATRHMINAEAIAKMKRGVMLINTSRGALIDTRALVNGLKSGRIGYAGLDVYEEESEYFFEDRSDRVITDDVLARLTTFHNVIVTSHQAFLTTEALNKIADITLESIQQFMSGKRGADLAYGVAAVG